MNKSAPTIDHDALVREAQYILLRKILNRAFCQDGRFLSRIKKDREIARTHFYSSQYDDYDSDVEDEQPDTSIDHPDASKRDDETIGTPHANVILFYDREGPTETAEQVAEADAIQEKRDFFRRFAANTSSIWARYSEEKGVTGSIPSTKPLSHPCRCTVKPSCAILYHIISAITTQHYTCSYFSRMYCLSTYERTYSLGKGPIFSTNFSTYNCS